MNFKTIGIPTIKLLVIAAVITTLLFLTNNTTEAKIAQNQADANVASRKEVLPDADDFDEKTVKLLVSKLQKLLMKHLVLVLNGSQQMHPVMRDVLSLSVISLKAVLLQL